MRSDFRALLLSSSDIAAEVDVRVYPLKLPQQPTYPAITYQVISDLPERQLGGKGRIQEARIQVDVWAGTIGKCEEIMGFIKTLLDGKDNTQGSTRFRSTFMDNERDLYEESIEKYRILADLDVRYWST